MPRAARQFSGTDLYHISLRGNDKSDIFYDDQDRYVFLDKMEEIKKKFNFQVNAYCLMDNHFHIGIRIKGEFLSKSIQSLGIRYTSYFNKKYNRSGHLFESRFYSKKIENLNYYLTVCKYIHRNPEKAGMSKTEDYKWSSYKEYIGKERLIDKKMLLYYFDSIDEFKKYTLENDDREQLYNYSEFELITKLSEDEVSNIIKQKFDLKNASDVSLLGKEQMNYIISSLKDLKGTSLAQIARITKVTPYYIKKIWND